MNDYRLAASLYHPQRFPKANVLKEMHNDYCLLATGVKWLLTFQRATIQNGRLSFQGKHGNEFHKRHWTSKMSFNKDSDINMVAY